jgi:parvulin-like peptidyl-prolyl isomerase
MTSFKLRLAIALAVIGGLLVSLVPAGAQTPQAGRIEIVEQILVKVNGEIITKTELEARQVQVLRQRGLQVSDAELQKAIAEQTPQILVDAVDELLLVQRARELGYRLGDDQFAEILERIKEENRLETEEAFQAALQQEGMTLADLRKQMERNMLISRVQQVEVWGRLSVTEEEAKNYYDAHSNEFTTPATVTLREILVAVESDGRGVNVGRDEEAKEKVEAARAAILGGETFEAAAVRMSDAPSKAIREMLQEMNVGDVSDAFRTTSGYQILQLESRVDAVVLPFDKARDDIGNKVVQRKQQQEFEKYLQRLRGQAIIEWKNQELRKLYEQRVEMLARAAPVQPEW